MIHTMDYVTYLQETWDYLLIIFYSFVFLTLLPKSWKNIHRFAKADAAANAIKYHRCYSPDTCCHHAMEGSILLPKQKPRKAVTRVYPKRQTNGGGDSIAAAAASKRATQPQKTLAQTNVNQIAKMFEAGTTTTTTTTNTSRKVNRVTPILTEIQSMVPATPESPVTPPGKNLSKKLIENPFKVGLSATITKENLENSVNLLNLRRVAASDHPGIEEEEDFHERSKSNLTLYVGQSVSPVSSPLAPSSPVSLKASLEDIFVAFSRSNDNAGNLKCSNNGSLSPVTSIEEILAQRRLSRPLSAYSISDLLCDSPMPDEAYIENFFRNLNKT